MEGQNRKTSKGNQTIFVKIPEMKKFNHKIVFLTLVFVALQFVACQNQKASNYEHIEPAHTEHIEGSELSKLTLTEKAVERIGVLTSTVTEESIASKGGYGEQTTQKVTPYGSLIYDFHGNTWVYTNPEPLVYVRHAIKIDHIIGDKVYLHEGPPVGTTVVTQAAAELYGTEYHVGH